MGSIPFVEYHGTYHFRAVGKKFEKHQLAVFKLWSILFEDKVYHIHRSLFVVDPLLPYQAIVVCMVPWTSEEPYVRACADATTRGLLMRG